MSSLWRSIVRDAVAPGFLPTPVERHLGQRGLQAAGRPPADGRRLRIVVRDTGGLDCEAATYPLAALRGMNCSVWVTHREGGSFQLTEDGHDTRVAGALWARFRKGEELVITASGPTPKGRLGFVARC